MPTLPTLTVTDEQAQRLLAAFGSVENYRNWLRDTLIYYVVSFEDRENRKESVTTKQQAYEQFKEEISS